jgi:pimeloyl-ACP methyl ester carboxylesterase
MEMCGKDDGGFVETLEGLPHAVLLLQADPHHGGALSHSAARRALTAHGRCRLVQFHATGHVIHRERPVEFVEAVTEFLSET